MDQGADKSTGVKRQIGLTTATSIVVANMIGAGIFTTTGMIASGLPGKIWVLYCWIFGGAIALSGALSYAELATRMPEEGGEFVYLKRLFHPVFGFLTGWTSFFVGFSAPIAGSALAFSHYFLSGLSMGEEVLSASTFALWAKGIAILLILVFTCIHYLGIRIGAIFQNSLTILKVMIITGLAFLGLLLGKGDAARILPLEFEHTEEIAFGTAMILVMFSYSGWNASTYIAGEVRNPQKNLPASLVMGTTIVIVIYLLLNLFIFYVLPYEDIKGNVTVVGTAAEKAFGFWTGNVLSLIISIALLSSLSAYIIVGPRVYYAMALDKQFFPFAAHIHSKYGVPGRAILVQGAIAIVMVLIGTLEQLLIYIEFAIGIFPIMATIGLFIARRRKIGEDTVVRVWGYPLVPLFFILCSLGILVIAFMNRPFESTTAIVTILCGIPLYFMVNLFTKTSEKKRRRSPGADPGSTSL